MEKKTYINPQVTVVMVQGESMICKSVVRPGEPDQPAGSRSASEWDDNE